MDTTPDGHPPLVLLAQVQRSGGTLLTRLLDGHPQLGVFPHELAWADSDYEWPSLNLALPADGIFASLVTDRFARLLGRYERDGYNKFGRSRSGTPLPFEHDLEIQRAIFRRQSPFRTRRHALDAFIASALEVQGQTGPHRWTVAFGKRHNLSPTIEDFFEDYPDGRLITIVRSPGTWLASATAHNPAEYQDLSAWKQSTEASLRLANKPNVLVLSFEQLVGSTREALDVVTAWLGVSKIEHPIPTFNGLEVHSNSAFGTKRGIDRAVLSREPDSQVPRSATELYESALAAIATRNTDLHRR